MLISTLLFSTIWLEVNASSPFSGLETKITIESNITKIKKMQLALTAFWLYSGEIDGIYKSVEKSLLDYQKNTWLIVNDTDYWAWYFWIKTLTALKEDYPQIFTEITEKYLQIDKPSTNVRYFYVTAYYSPLPGQKRYTTWSYRGDKKLNWEWKITASWKWVFEWVLAGPRNYAYWTKIELQWLGVWVVEDRGWAIVNSWERGFEYDRIDVWMWYGDEWLARALKWGKRKIEWKVVPSTRSISMEFDTSIVAKYIDLKVDAENPKKENVIRLQNLFTELKMYSGSIDWNFNNIKDQLIHFQVENNIISSKNSDHTWYFGNKTYIALRKAYGSGIFKMKNNTLDEDVILAQNIREKLDLLNNKISLLVETKYWKDTVRAIKYRRDLRTAIDYQTKKITNDLRKRQLKYLKSLI